MIIFAENHWHFTSHYLRVAYMFRLLFRRHSEDDLSEIQLRKARIRVLNISISVLIAVVGASLALTYAILQMFIWWMFCTFCWSLAIVNLCSMRYILKQSQKPL